MFTVDDFQERIHKANVALHRLEARYYDSLHSEIFNRTEQERISSALRIVDKLIEGNRRKALDLGAGTGNLTGKLLRLGYEVTAVDISKEMCEILEKKYTNSFENGKLMVVHSTIEDASFDKDEFDLIACYSVLHHLPNYLHVLQKLCGLLKKGGIMYLDHENAPFGCGEPTHRIRYVYLRSEWLLDH